MNRAAVVAAAIALAALIVVLAANFAGDLSKEERAGLASVAGIVLGIAAKAAVDIYIKGRDRAAEDERREQDRVAARDQERRAEIARREAEARAVREQARQAAVPLQATLSDVALCLRSGYWPARRELHADLSREQVGAISAQLSDVWTVVHW